ncbi:GIN domain-containing protein [Chloroflexota bacterium]
MKKSIMLTIFVTAMMTAALSYGCEATVPVGVGGKDVITEEKDFTDFNRVEVEGTFEVKISQSDTFSTIVSADTDFFDYIDVSKKGDSLKISLNPRHTFTDFTLQAKTLKAEITMPALYGFSLSGASNGVVTGFKSSEDLDIVISGASSLEMADFEADDAEFEISGASKVAGNMNVNDVKFRISGASVVELAGKAKDIILEASGASKVTLPDCQLNNASIALSGASEATVNAKGRLDCMLSAASRLYFYGNPTMGNIDVSGASTIKHK